MNREMNGGRGREMRDREMGRSHLFQRRILGTLLGMDWESMKTECRIRVEKVQRWIWPVVW
jgi:hypothetical protein